MRNTCFPEFHSRHHLWTTRDIWKIEMKLPPFSFGLEDLYRAWGAVTTHACSHLTCWLTWLVSDSVWVPWISSFRFSHFWDRCVFNSLGKSMRFTCKTKLESWRQWDADMGSGPSLQISLILAGCISSLLPFFMVVFFPQLLALLTLDFSMKPKNNSLCVQFNQFPQLSKNQIDKFL